MAVTKIIGAIHAPKSGGKHDSMAKAINYVLNPQKTDGGRLTGSINCIKTTALKEMIATKQLYGKDAGDKRDRQAYHFAISWSPEEKITPDLALDIIKEFAEKYLGDKYEAVYSVHNDHDHVHGHIVFNSVNMQDGRKFRYEDGDWAKIIQPLVDDICACHGLHTLSEDTGMALEDYEEERKKIKSRRTQQKRRENTEHKSNSNNRYHKDSEKKYSWNDHIKEDIDYAMLNSNSFDEFESMLQNMGYQIRYGNSEKYGTSMKLKAPGMDIYRRTYALGPEYTLQRIKECIEIRAKPLPVSVLPENVRMVIPVGYYTKYRKLPLNPALRRYYRSLYRLGIKPNYPKRNYRVSKEAVERAERAEKKLLLRLNYNIMDRPGTLRLIKQKEEELDALKQEQKEMYERHGPYKRMLKAYRMAWDLRDDYDAYLAGDESKRENALKYKQQEKAFKKYGFGEDEVKQYGKARTAEYREMKERIREGQIAVEAAKELEREYAEEPDDTFTEEEELFYNSIQPAVTNGAREK